MIALAAWHVYLSLILLVSDATVDARCGPMIGTHQTVEKLFPHLLKVGAAEGTEQFHSIETVSPCVEHFGAGRSAEGEFLIRQRQHFRHGKSRPLQMTFQLAAHMEIVPSGCERIFRVGPEQRLRPITDRLMSEQIVNFRENDPTVRF